MQRIITRTDKLYQQQNNIRGYQAVCTGQAAVCKVSTPKRAPARLIGIFVSGLALRFGFLAREFSKLKV